MNQVIQYRGTTRVLRADSVAELLRNDIFFAGDLEYNKSKSYDEKMVGDNYLPSAPDDYSYDDRWKENTGLKDYPFDEEEVEIMSPEDYINECADVLGTSFEDLVEERYNDDTPTYAIQMAEGDKFNMPVIDYKNKYQDGIHRAMACMLLGEKWLPVMVVR